MYCFQDHTQKCGDIVFHAFDPVIVRLSLNSNNIQHEKLVLELVSPYIEGFSIPLSEKESDVTEKTTQNISENPMLLQEKRKSEESRKSKKKHKK